MSYRIMVLNLGSTSFKFKYYSDGASLCESATGVFENIGETESDYNISFEGLTRKGSCYIENHRAAFDIACEALLESSFFGGLDKIDAVCYKAVHCGTITGMHSVNDELIEKMHQYICFAPVHNTIYIDMMKKMREKYPQLLQLAYFETSFHASIPEKRALYGVPFEWHEELGVRRYGFHGSSHRYIAEKMKMIAPEFKRIISIHLGGSSSICAIEDGKSIACSMGATPQSGLFQNNRVGDFDAFCLPALMQKYNWSINTALDMLSKQSGLLGVSGVSNDIRDVLNEAKAGNRRAELCIEAYCDNIVGYIGMFNAYLKGVQAIVFTGGIGRNSIEIRNIVCDALLFTGIEIDKEINENNKEGMISTSDSSIHVFVLKTNEEFVLAQECQKYLETLN